jgi:hypothetical protein
LALYCFRVFEFTHSNIAATEPKKCKVTNNALRGRLKESIENLHSIGILLFIEESLPLHELRLLCLAWHVLVLPSSSSRII